MFIIGKNKKKLNEANEKALTSVCTVQVQKIFALLHAKAITTVEKECPTCKIENTAADGNDPQKAVFHSAGEHMIVVRSSGKEDKNGNPANVTKKDALKAIQIYVSIFCGKDIGEKIKDDEVFPLLTGDNEEAMTESIIPSFSMFLSESAGMKFIVEADEMGDDENDDEMGDLDGADEMGDEDDDDEAGEEDDDDEAGEEDDDDEAGEEDDDDEAGEEEEDDGEETDDEKTAAGYYLLYGLKIKGLKETTVADALKQFGSNFLKGFGIRLIDGWGSSGGELHTIGGLKKGLRGLFGAIDDPNQLAERVQKEIRKKYPNLGEPDVEFRDKKTLVNDLDITKRDGYNGKVKQKILGAQYSLYIKVNESDPRKPLLNRKIIANLVTMQIKGLFKKFKNIIKVDDVIYLSGSELTKANPAAIKKLEDKIPTYDQVEEIVKKEKTYQRVWVKLEKLFDTAILKDSAYTSSQKCKDAVQPWVNFKKKYEYKSENLVKDQKFKPVDPAKPTEEERIKAFKSFLIAYEDALEDSDNELQVDESIITAYDMLTEMFGNNKWNNYAINMFEDDSIDQQASVDTQTNQSKKQSNDIKTSSSNDDSTKNSASNTQEKVNKDSTENTSDQNISDKTDDETNSESNADDKNNKHGDDLYIIPMPGVTFDASSDKDDLKGAGYEND